MKCQCEHSTHNCNEFDTCVNAATVNVLTVQGWYRICSNCYKDRHMAYPHTEYLDTHMEP